MNIIIKSKNCDLTPSFKEYIEQKIGSLEKYSTMFKENKDSGPAKEKAKVEIMVEVGKITLHHKKGDLFEAECHIIFPGKTLTARASSEDLKKSVNMVRKELQRQITSYKDKLIEQSRKP